MELHIFLQQVINGIILGSIYGLIAIGYSMVYGIIRMINFAHGDIYMISAYLTAIFISLLSGFFAAMNFTNANAAILILTVFFTMSVTAIYGYSIEKIAYKPLRGAARLSLLISAIGMSLILQSYVQLSQGSSNKIVPNLMYGVIKISLGSPEKFIQISQIQFTIIVMAFISMLGLYFIVNKTSMGRAMRATSEDRIMANLIGIDSNKTISNVFIIGAIAASIAGFLVSMNYGSFDFNLGFITGIKAFTAAVLGGIGSLPGAMLGGLILGLSESLFAGFVNSDYKDVFAFGLLIVILIFKPTGLLGKPEISKV